MKIKEILRWVLAAMMVFAGVSHFTNPEGFVEIVPPYLPWPLALVYISGVFEILGGIGLLIPKISKAAAWGLVALYIAVFPANIHMAIHNLPFRGTQPTQTMQYVRLALQFVLIAWAFWYTRPPLKR